jgi:hypothetical protein
MIDTDHDHQVQTATLTSEWKADPEHYIRINISRNTKGYSAETTVSVRWVGTPDEQADALRELLHQADTLAREEVALRKIEDAKED